MQHTLSAPVTLRGVGLHTGKNTSVTLKPAPVDHGFSFTRTDLAERPAIPALVQHVAHANRGTTLCIGDVYVRTVEHLLAALSGLRLDNVEIEIDGEEVPLLDGSSAEYVKAIRAVGMQEQKAPVREFILRDPVHLIQGDQSIVALPCSKISFSETIVYTKAGLGAQHIDIDLTPESFESGLSLARTFCLKEEVDALRAAGMIKGGSLDNAVVFDNGRPLNPPLRYEDEPVRHKVLDLIGDLSLLGRRMRARVIAVRSGHAFNVDFVKLLHDRYMRTPQGAAERCREHMPDTVLDIDAIKHIIPHRYPFLLIDRVLGMDRELIIGIKNVTASEAYFQGHFPDRPVMPGVLIIEALAQLGAVHLLKNLDLSGKVVYFLGLDKVKWRRPVVPGDTLVLESRAIKVGKKLGAMAGQVFVDGQLVCEGELKYSVID